MLSTMLPTHSVIAAVGSDSNGLYVEVSARWDLPSATYVERSCMTMQLPLSAFLITRSLFLPSSCRVLASFLERFGFGFLLSSSSAGVFSMYSSSFGLLALGGAHCDLGLNGCFLCCRVLLRK